MNLKWQSQILIDRLVTFVTNVAEVIEDRRRPVTHQPVSALYVEICEMEEALAKASIRSAQLIRTKSQFMEPVTEQQKIMDMSG